MCLSNKATLFQTKGSISDGALRVTYYDSRGIVSCNFIFHVADPNYAYQRILEHSAVCSPPDIEKLMYREQIKITRVGIWKFLKKYHSTGTIARR